MRTIDGTVEAPGDCIGCEESTACDGCGEGDSRGRIDPKSTNPGGAGGDKPGTGKGGVAEAGMAGFTDYTACLVKCINSLWGAGYPAGLPGAVGGTITYKSLPLTPVPGKNKSAPTKGTSKLSEWSRKTWPGSMSKRRWAPTLRKPFSTTASRGGFRGRWIGWGGTAAFILDAAVLTGCINKCVKSGQGR